MKILVTGGAGFIGSHVVEAYCKEGHTVVVVDNLRTGNKLHLHPNVHFYSCDITSKELFSIFEKEKPDIVNHHAAQMNVRKSLEDPRFDAEVNILGLLNVLSCSVKTNVKKFIFISSGGAVYGNAEQLPLSENASISPLSPYGLAKYVGEQYVQLFYHLHGLPYTILRYANVYGPRQNPLGEAGVISIFIHALLLGKQPTLFGDGEQTRDYIYVADIVDANLLCLTKGQNELFNLGTEKETSVNTLLSLLQSSLSSSLKPVYLPKRAGEVSRNTLDCHKARSLLGWQARYSLEQGIAETIHWLQKNQGALL